MKPICNTVWFQLAAPRKASHSALEPLLLEPNELALLLLPELLLQSSAAGTGRAWPVRSASVTSLVPRISSMQVHGLSAPMPLCSADRDFWCPRVLAKSA